ncbi:MAG TPA: LPS export ABC transporter periplasmic protein LptC [Burkholderiales bacterium]|nr:LPS export ABC transporter periplasmic protein LptC [Burkholderiales bacterium]
MMHRLTLWFPVALLTAITALTFWIDHLSQPSDLPREGKLRHDPDYIVEDFSATRIGEDGTPRYTLSARRMTHYPDDDSTQLEAPRFVHFSRSRAPIVATSRTAWVSSNGETAKLRDDVKIVREASGDRSELVLETSTLEIIPDSNLAQTDQPVSIRDGNTLMTGVGLEFNNETHVLKLLSHVQGVHENPRARTRG